MNRLLLLAVLALVGLSAPSVEAQDRSPPLLGERDLGMAGAVTASSSGPSAAYYNPAGLTAIDRTAVGASLSLRTFRSYGVARGYSSSIGVEDLDDVQLDSSSVFLGAVVTFGGRNALGLRSHALAAGTLVRSSVDRRFVDDAVDPTLDLASDIDITDRRSDRWYYLSYSGRPSTALSLGLTAAISVRGDTYREGANDGSGLSGTSNAARLTSRSVDLAHETIYLVLRAGATLRLTDWLQAGLTFQAPGIPLANSGRAEFVRLSIDPPNSTLYQRAVDFEGTIPSPFELRGGLFARVAPELGVGLDVGVIGPIGSRDDPWLTLGGPVPRDGERPAATYFATDRTSDVDLHVALGAEVDVLQTIPIRAGFFYERSGNPGTSVPASIYRLDSVDRIGGTVSVGIHDDHYDFTVGATYAYGWGNGARPDAGPEGFSYLPTTVESHQINLVLSGVTGAAADLALEAYRALSGSERAEISDEELFYALPLPPRELTNEDLRRLLPLPARAVDADPADAVEEEPPLDSPAETESREPQAE